MKQIVIAEKKETVNLQEVDDATPIFVKRDGKLWGLVARVGGRVSRDERWQIRTGGAYFECGGHVRRADCINQGLGYGYKFFIED